MMWENLKNIDLKVLVEPLPREPSVQQLYIERRSDPTYQCRLVAMLRDGLYSRGGIWLRENDYPYQTPPGVEHRVLWFTDTILSLKDAQSWVMEYLGLIESQIVVCCNDPSLKTVPEINHYHVFICS